MRNNIIHPQYANNIKVKQQKAIKTYVTGSKLELKIMYFDRRYGHMDTEKRRRIPVKDPDRCVQS